MDDTKRGELEKVCKKKKGHKIRVRMVAIRMARVLNMSMEETQYSGTLAAVLVS